jgi:hypothetical protein
MSEEKNIEQDGIPIATYLPAGTVGTERQEEVNKTNPIAGQAGSKKETIEPPDTREQLVDYNLALTTQEMEVHHHPHVEKKNFKEYFLEFLMIFLAVTMGFVAENLREHFVERKREKEYMVSLVSDLHRDITALKARINSMKEDITMADSVFLLLEKADYKSTSGSLYYFGRRLSLRNFFRPNDGTTQQLNYAGGLRLIENEKVVDSIQQYINRITGLLTLIQLEDMELTEYRKSMNGVFDGLVVNKMNGNASDSRLQRLNYNPPLISYEKKDINNVAMQLSIVKGNRVKQVDFMDRTLTSAELLVSLIQNEYDVKDE